MFFYEEPTESYLKYHFLSLGLKNRPHFKGFYQPRSGMVIKRVECRGWWILGHLGPDVFQNMSNLKNCDISN